LDAIEIASKTSEHTDADGYHMNKRRLKSMTGKSMRAELREMCMLLDLDTMFEVSN
jgi:hypothetical protein